MSEAHTPLITFGKMGFILSSLYQAQEKNKVRKIFHSPFTTALLLTSWYKHTPPRVLPGDY